MAYSNRPHKCVSRILYKYYFSCLAPSSTIPATAYMKTVSLARATNITRERDLSGASHMMFSVPAGVAAPIWPEMVSKNQNQISKKMDSIYPHLLCSPIQIREKKSKIKLKFFSNPVPPTNLIGYEGPNITSYDVMLPWP